MRSLVSLFLLATLLCSAQSRNVSDEEVRRVHRAALLIDLHNDVPMKTVEGFDIGSSAPRGSTDIARLRAGNLGAQFFAAYVPGSYAKSGKAAEYCRRVIRSIREDIVGKHPTVFRFATTADEIVAARSENKIAALIGIEGGHAIEDSLENLREFFKMGARYMTLTHSNTNNWADSSGDINRSGVRHHGGLNELGRKVVLEMNRIGMMVDVSHVADETFWDVMEVSKVPVIASHSSCRALSPARRNMTDDMIRALGKSGGVIHINFACSFFNARSNSEEAKRRPYQAKYGNDMDAQRAEIEKRFTRATIDDVVAHIQHVAKVAGIDYVGLGSDFDGVDCTPVNLEDVGKFPNLTRALLEKGFTPEQIRKVYGENTLRVMRAVEQAAAASAARR